jgi:hypothetical protein
LPIGSATAGTHCTIRQLQILKSSIGEVCQLTASYEAKLGAAYPPVTLDSGGPIMVASVTPCGPPPPPVIEVGIDIKPGAMPNSINVSSKGSIPVAILSGSTFYAPVDVDLSYPMMFGGFGMQPNLVRCNATGVDVNLDGLVDLVCHFATPLTGFQTGDELGFLIGMAKDGSYIVGSDSVRIVR